MAITVAKNRTVVQGNEKVKFYTLTGINADTLATGLKIVDLVTTNNPGVVTSVTASGGTITFNSTGAYTGILVKVEGK